MEWMAEPIGNARNDDFELKGGINLYTEGEQWVGDGIIMLTPLVQQTQQWVAMAGISWYFPDEYSLLLSLSHVPGSYSILCYHHLWENACAIATYWVASHPCPPRSLGTGYQKFSFLSPIWWWPPLLQQYNSPIHFAVYLNFIRFHHVHHKPHHHL